jgi:hypothetical protein
MMQETTEAPVETRDGRRDFDFLYGTWAMKNRRLENPVADDPGEWQEFVSSLETRPILGGLGNIDLYEAPDFPGRPGFHGFGLRLFDPTENVWRIWWASTVSDGQIDTPVVGRFENGEGRFECDDVLGGRAVRVRYEWKDITPTSARWVQSFSFDGGRTFEPNWIVELGRTA